MKHIFSKQKTKNKRTKIAVIATLVIVALALTFIWFNRQLHTVITNTNNSFLTETASHQASLFNTKLHDQLSILESVAKQFADVDFNNYSELKSTVAGLQDIADFKQMTVADSSGACLSNNSMYSKNISKKHYFQSALKGTPTVSNSMDIDIAGQDILSLSVPIHQGDKIVGVLTGIYDRSVLDSLFSTTMFNGEGYTYIINSSGDIMVKTDNKNAIVKEPNYLTFLSRVDMLSDKTYDEVLKDLSEGKADTIHYKSGPYERYVSYYPVGIHDWYVISVITNEVIRTQAQQLSLIIVVLVLVLSITLFSAFMLILSILHKAEMAMLRNERYDLVNLQTQSVIFDYNANTGILELSGSTEFIFGEAYPLKAPINMDLIRKNTHPDDISNINAFTDCCKNGESYNPFEFRFKCSDDNYYWFRLSSTLVRKDDAVVKIVGNLINVESQKNHELSLKQKAEHDMLTGLLNKTSMANYVGEFLLHEDSDSIHAFFIIDLDNFKSVNDTFGHVFGDKVLIDTAAKISRIFSEKDFIGRIGGDEFCAFLNLSNIDSLDTAKRIIQQKGSALQTELRETYRGQSSAEVTVSASIGIALYIQDGADYITLYQNADQALYESKHLGKNTYTFYNDIN